MQDAGEKTEHFAEKPGRYKKKQNPDHTSRDKKKYLWYEKKTFSGINGKETFQTN